MGSADDGDTLGASPDAAAPSPAPVEAVAPQTDPEPAGSADARPAVVPEPARASTPANAAPAPDGGPSGTPASPAATGEEIERRRGERVERARVRDQLLASAARTLALCSMLGAAVVVWAQVSFQARWVGQFLINNELEPERRSTLILSTVIGALCGGLIGAVVLGLRLRRRLPLAEVERFAWFLSPLAVLLPAIPLLFRPKPWRDRHVDLLIALLVSNLVLEVFLARSFASIPERVKRAKDWLSLKVPPFLRRHGPLLIVVAAALFYAVFMSFYHVRWHHKLKTHSFDLGIGDNLLYGGLKGVFMHSPIVNGGDPAKYLATHAKYGLYLFLPIYALAPRAETLITIQATTLGLSAIPLFLFARRHVSEWMAAAVAIAWVCYYPMHSANFYEVHEVPIAAFFVISAVWAAEVRRWVLFGLAFVAAMLMREDIPIGTAVVGALLLVTGHRPIPGLIMAVVSTLWFVFMRFYVMDSAGEWWFPDMYKGLLAPGEKKGFMSVLKTVVTNPLFVLGKVLEAKKVQYLLHLFLPLAFLPARRFWLWLGFLPGVLLTLLITSYEAPYMYSFHYVMHWAPYLFMGAVIALASIGRSPDTGIPRMRAAACVMLFASLVLTYNYGAFPRRAGSLKGGYFAIDFDFSDAERERYAKLKRLMDKIPPEASVATTEGIGPHLSSRRYLYSMRQNTWGAEWLLVSSKEQNLDNTKRTLKRAFESGEYGVLERIDEFALLKRGHDTSGNAKLIQDFGL